MFKIIIDTREQQPANFSFFECETVSRKLDTGDYSIEGHESQITIDRKFGVSELYGNCFKDYVRFKKELIRMTEFEAAYFVCEFPYSHVLEFPNHGFPKNKASKLQFTAQHLIDKIEHIKEKYGVEFIFCDGKIEAAEVIFKILKEFYEKQRMD